MEGIPHSKENVTLFEQVKNAQKSYKLNRKDSETVIRQVVAVELCRIAGDWNALDNNVQLPYLDENNKLFYGRREGLFVTLRAHNAGRADDLKCKECRQENNETILHDFSCLKKSFNANFGVGFT